MKARRSIALTLAVLMLLSLTACGASASKEAASNGMYYDRVESESPAEAPEYALAETTAAASANLPADRKMIRTISIDAETEDMATLTDTLTQRVTDLGGYVESKNLYNGSIYAGYIRRTLSMTVRIPAQRADEFVARVTENANVVSSGESVDDVTLKYVDTESHVKALETEQERLLVLLEQAATLKDILTLEERLTSVRYELERYASQLRTLDNQVNYATIRLTVTEVKEYTPVVTEEPTVWQQISHGFSRSLKNIGGNLKDLFVWMAVNSPYLVIWGILGTGVFLLLRRKKLPSFRKPKKTGTPEEKSE